MKVDEQGGYELPDYVLGELKHSRITGVVLEGEITISLPPPPDGKRWVLAEGKRRFDGPLLEALAE